MILTMTEELDRMIQRIEEDIENGRPTNMPQRSKDFTSDVIVSIAFGENWGGRDDHPAQVYLDKVSAPLTGLSTDLVSISLASMQREIFASMERFSTKKCEKLWKDALQ
jgi:hypothetical protein